MENLMISIVTPSLNQASFLEKNILSVLNQNYANFEQIVVDGGSTDGSVDILKKYHHLKWVSEKDDGQAQAINKGFKLAKGDIIGWLNSDDVYRHGAFNKAAEVFNRHPDVDFIFSHCLRIDKDDNILSMGVGKNPLNFDVLLNPNFIQQPTVFFRNCVFRKTGYLDENFFLAMDIDYWRRIIKNHKMMLVNDIFACFRIHTESKTTKYLNGFKHESKRSFFENGGTVFSPFYFETFIKPKLMKIFIYNPIFKRLFFNVR
jgi:glycosyltransferase involved in cell wall biosynthesis